MPSALLMVPWNAGPASVTPRCSGQSPICGEQPVRLHHDDGVVVLDRDLEVVEVVLLEEARLPPCALGERLGRRLAVLLQQPRVERSGVDADAQRDAGILRRLRDRADLIVELADVAGVDAHCGAARVDRLEDVLRLEVDVGDDRDLALLRDDVQHVGVVLRRHRDAHDLAAGCRELGDLLERRIDVRRRRRAHRLDAHGRVAADQHLADPDLPGLAAGGEDFGDFRHPEIHCWHAPSLRRRRAGREPARSRDANPPPCAGVVSGHEPQPPSDPMTGRDPHESESCGDAARAALRPHFRRRVQPDLGRRLRTASSSGDVGTALAGFAFTTFAVSWAWINYSWLASPTTTTTSSSASRRSS